MSKVLQFGEALAVARSLGLASRFEWTEWCKEGMRPTKVPAAPDRAYKGGGWQGWGHWLGTRNQSSKAKKEQFLPFEEALAAARSLGLASQKEWEQWGKEGMRPPKVPAAPNRTYKGGGWRGWGHWLGTGNQANQAKMFLPFAEALAVARSLNLANQKEWELWSREGLRPHNVPAHPARTYKGGGWQGWGHWLGTRNQPSKAKKEQFLPFDEALLVARQLLLNSSREWKLWCRSGARPANVPADPPKFYVHGGWIGWKHWLCHGNHSPAAALAHAAGHSNAPQGPIATPRAPFCRGATNSPAPARRRAAPDPESNPAASPARHKRQRRR